MTDPSKNVGTGEDANVSPASFATNTTHDHPAVVREVTMANRAMVAGIAEALIDDDNPKAGYALIEAVRCCDEFPECSHVLDWIADA